MNTENLKQSQKAVESTARTTIDNANKLLDLTLNRSAKLLEKNVEATKATIERHNAYVSNLGNVRSVEDLAKVQESISKTEVDALENFSREIYDLTSKTAADLAKVSDSNRNATNDLVNDTLETMVDSIPNGDSQPYGSVYKDAVRTQIEAFNAFNSFVEKTVATQQANFSNLAETIVDAAKAAPVAGKAKRKK